MTPPRSTAPQNQPEARRRGPGPEEAPITGNARKYFNTDGIRGPVGTPPITPDFVLKLGWAVGKALGEEFDKPGPVLVGKDTRASGYMFESALEAGLAAAGVEVRLLGPLPTPAIAYLTRNTRAHAGIVISASHNPHFDNGIKLFSADGKKLSDAVEMKIEEILDTPLAVVGPNRMGKASRIVDAARRYMEFCKSQVEVDLSGLRLIVDCANGAAYQVAPRVFEELGAEVRAIGAAPDGFNINHGVGATSPEELQGVVKEQRADLGIALDGDGDRLIMVDHCGELVDGDETLRIIAADQKDGLQGVVGTVMSNLGLQKAVEEDLGLPFHRAKVGDRYVLELLEKEGLVLGGEPTGHIVNRNLLDSGDGILSALQALAAMRRAGASLRELRDGMKKYPQKLVNVAWAGRPANLAEDPEIVHAVAAVKEGLGANGRVVLRPSGTEAVFRIMVEGEDADLVDTSLQDLARRVENKIPQENRL